MTKKTMISEAKDSVVDAAQAGLEGVKDVAGEALGAAAAAATAVVFERALGALVAGERQIEAAAPAAAEAARMAAAQPFMSAPAARVIARKPAAHKTPKTATSKPESRQAVQRQGKSDCPQVTVVQRSNIGGKPVAEETILEQAVGMIPGMGKSKPKRGRKKASHDTYLSVIQKNLSELAHAVEKLGAMVTGSSATKPAAKRRAAPKKASAKRTGASAAAKRRTAAKPRKASAGTRGTKRK